MIKSSFVGLRNDAPRWNRYNPQEDDVLAMAISISAPVGLLSFERTYLNAVASGHSVVPPIRLSEVGHVYWFFTVMAKSLATLFCVDRECDIYETGIPGLSAVQSMSNIVSPFSDEMAIVHSGWLCTSTVSGLSNPFANSKNIHEHYTMEPARVWDAARMMDNNIDGTGRKSWESLSAKVCASASCAAPMPASQTPSCARVIGGRVVTKHSASNELTQRRDALMSCNDAVRNARIGTAYIGTRAALSTRQKFRSTHDPPLKWSPIASHYIDSELDHLTSRVLALRMSSERVATVLAVIGYVETAVFGFVLTEQVMSGSVVPCFKSLEVYTAWRSAYTHKDPVYAALSAGSTFVRNNMDAVSNPGFTCADIPLFREECILYLVRAIVITLDAHRMSACLIVRTSMPPHMERRRSSLVKLGALLMPADMAEVTTVVRNHCRPPHCSDALIEKALSDATENAITHVVGMVRAEWKKSGEPLTPLVSLDAVVYKHLLPVYHPAAVDYASTVPHVYSAAHHFTSAPLRAIRASLRVSALRMFCASMLNDGTRTTLEELCKVNHLAWHTTHTSLHGRYIPNKSPLTIWLSVLTPGGTLNVTGEWTTSAGVPFSSGTVPAAVVPYSLSNTIHTMCVGSFPIVGLAASCSDAVIVINIRLTAVGTDSVKLCDFYPITISLTQ